MKNIISAILTPIVLTISSPVSSSVLIQSSTNNIKDSKSGKENISMKAPTAKQVPHSFTHHGITVEDPWNWLKDQSYPKIDDEDILSYLREENAYFEHHMKAQKPLVDELFKEMKARIKEDDSSVPQKDGDYIYWSAFDKGAQYRKYYRKAVSGGDDQLILDENTLADGKEYFRLGASAVSPDGNLLAYAYDDNGSERFEIHVKDLRTGKELPDIIPGILSSIVWAADSGGFVYGLANENWRTDNLKYHRLGDDPKKAKEIFREADEGYRVDAGLSAQEDWIIIGTGDNITSEVYVVPTSDPTAEPRLVKARKDGVQYTVDIRDGKLFILTNDDHVNFRLATADFEKPESWETLITGSDETYLTGFELFKDYFVTESRVAGLDQIDIRDYSDVSKKQRIKFPEASYVASTSNNPEYDSKKLRLSYESMITPDTVYDYDVASNSLEALKVQVIPSGYDASQYETERLMMTARDGVQVPVSVVYKKGFQRDGSQPLHLYAYGAYGYAVPPGFSTTRFSLIDRGFAYAIAHIRGGDDLGYQWYLDGKLKKRTNTFNDFVDVGKGLIEQGYTSAGKLTASGGSAGGELMGAVANQSPEIFGAVVAHVPFVDVLNTMLDESLPLTPGEWPEWGNPITSKEDFEFIRSYSPYGQVESKDYPPMLYTGGLNDPRVTYWEPAKMVAKLRYLKTDDNLLLMKINMGAGHGGKSGRWNSIYEVAEEQAFILWQLGLVE